jgi:hypothetical protein
MPTTIPQAIADIRRALDFFEAHPELHNTHPSLSFRVWIFLNDPAKFTEAARVLADGTSIDSPLVKASDANYRILRRKFGSSASIELNQAHQLACERVMVGTKQVEKSVVVTPAVTTTELVDEPIYEWRCEPVLAPVADAPAPVVVDNEPF